MTPEHLFHTFLNNLKTLVHKRIWRRQYQRIDQMLTNAMQLRIWKKLAVECFSVLRSINEPITWTSGRISHCFTEVQTPTATSTCSVKRFSDIIRPPGRFDVIFIIYIYVMPNKNFRNEETVNFIKEFTYVKYSATKV